MLCGLLAFLFSKVGRAGLKVRSQIKEYDFCLKPKLAETVQTVIT